MSHGIGIFPGGPHGAASGKEIQRPPRLMRVEEVEDRIARDSTRRARRRRRKLLVLTLLLAISAAGGGVGLILRHSAHGTAEELTKALELKRSLDSGIPEEINRALRELWKMEEVEFARNRRSR